MSWCDSGSGIGSSSERNAWDLVAEIGDIISLEVLVGVLVLSTLKIGDSAFGIEALRSLRCSTLLMSNAVSFWLRKVMGFTFKDLDHEPLLICELLSLQHIVGLLFELRVRTSITAAFPPVDHCLKACVDCNYSTPKYKDNSDTENAKGRVFCDLNFLLHRQRIEKKKLR